MVAAARAKGMTVIEGAQELRVKETDRIRAMVSNLSKLGANVKVKSLKKTDNIVISGCANFRPARLKSFGDHRTAMSMMVASCAAGGPCSLDDVSCVSKSFPEFGNALSHLFD
jgi:3-phosphoshikimate 1-carboxyvinyltransferase